MMPRLTLPAEGVYTDIEHDFIDNEPPGLFPSGQDSYWGQVRKVYADYLQGLADQLVNWYVNLDPRTVTIDDVPEWESMLGVPVGTTTRTLNARRSFILSRFARGPFTRTRRRLVVESFISATFGDPIIFDSLGVAFSAGGIPFFSDGSTLVGTYNIVENIPNFSYDVRVLNTIAIDQVGLQRELARMTPAGITFTITMTAAP